MKTSGNVSTMTIPSLRTNTNAFWGESIIRDEKEKEKNINETSRCFRAEYETISEKTSPFLPLYPYHVYSIGTRKIENKKTKTKKNTERMFRRSWFSTTFLTNSQIYRESWVVIREVFFHPSGCIARYRDKRYTLFDQQRASLQWIV